MKYKITKDKRIKPFAKYKNNKINKILLNDKNFMNLMKKLENC